MKSRLLTATAAFVFSFSTISYVQADPQGGDVFDATLSGEGFLFFDTVEYGDSFDPAQLPEFEIVDSRLKSLASFLPQTVQFLRDTLAVAHWSFVKPSLVSQATTGSSHLIITYQKIQAALTDAQRLTVQINKDVWSQLTADSRAYLIVHQLIWLAELSNKGYEDLAPNDMTYRPNGGSFSKSDPSSGPFATDSASIRRLVAMIMSKANLNATVGDFELAIRLNAAVGELKLSDPYNGIVLSKLDYVVLDRKPFVDGDDSRRKVLRVSPLGAYAKRDLLEFHRVTKQEADTRYYNQLLDQLKKDPLVTKLRNDFANASRPVPLDLLINSNEPKWRCSFFFIPSPTKVPEPVVSGYSLKLDRSDFDPLMPVTKDPLLDTTYLNLKHGYMDSWSWLFLVNGSGTLNLSSEVNGIRESLSMRLRDNSTDLLGELLGDFGFDPVLPIDGHPTKAAGYLVCKLWEMKFRGIAEVKSRRSSCNDEQKQEAFKISKQFAIAECKKSHMTRPERCEQLEKDPSWFPFFSFGYDSKLKVCRLEADWRYLAF